jgi:hypothetical protein
VAVRRSGRRERRRRGTGAGTGTEVGRLGRSQEDEVGAEELGGRREVELGRTRLLLHLQPTGKGGGSGAQPPRTAGREGEGEGEEARDAQLAVRRERICRHSGDGGARERQRGGGWMDKVEMRG